nr:MAG TPA: hypothetical protein [Caudoviricetes sp.]
MDSLRSSFYIWSLTKSISHLRTLISYTQFRTFVLSKYRCSSLS